MIKATELSSGMLSTTELYPSWNSSVEMSDDDYLMLVKKTKKYLYVQKPIVVRKRGRGYQILVGEYHWRAAVAAGLEHVFCIIIPDDDFEAYRQTFQRGQGGRHNPLYRGRIIREMLKLRALSTGELADLIDLSESTITSCLMYAKAFDLHSKFVARCPYFPPYGDRLDWKISRLSPKQVQVYLELPPKIRDYWLDANSPLKEVNKYFGCKSKRPTLFTDILKKGLEKSLDRRSETGFDQALRRAADCLAWLNKYPAIDNAKSYAQAVVFNGFPAAVLNCLPINVHQNRITVSLACIEWVGSLPRNQPPELSDVALCEKVRRRVAARLAANGVQVGDDYLRHNHLVLKLTNAPDFIRGAACLTLREKCELAEYAPNAPVDLLTAAKQKTCEEFARRRSGGDRLTKGVRKVCLEILNSLPENQRIEEVQTVVRRHLEFGLSSN